jgi:GTP-binding protein
VGCSAPNAGKSTLLSRISAAKPKVADYPFTTLFPVLGVVEVDGDTLVVADIPGIIEGAHAGAWLGLDFLRHVERTEALAHVVDASGTSGRDPVLDLRTVREEVRLWNPSLLGRPQIVVASKRDALSEKTIAGPRRGGPPARPPGDRGLVGHGAGPRRSQSAC